MPTTTILVDAEIKARLSDLARQAGQEVDQFAEALLRQVAETDVRFERGCLCYPGDRAPQSSGLRMSTVS